MIFFLRSSLNSILLIFIFSSLLLAQELVTVSGTVFDSETMERLSGTELIIEEIGRGTISDENGDYNFTGIPQGEYTISAGFIGYRVSKQQLITRNISQTSLVIMLMPIILKGQTIEVTATRAAEGESPVAFSNITRDELEDYYTASDIPMLLDQLPGVYSYSLTGDNLGYSFLKIRGFDQSHVGVMINEIPLNDPEDHQVYWVDHPDLAESVEDIQVQRGVGTSIYGTSTFGGSVNINTKNFSSRMMTKITFGGGSFNTRKVLVEYQSGMVQNTYGFYGRISKITSDGYRRHSSSDLLSYFLGVERYDRNMVTRLNIFNGHERTHPDWDGVPEDILTTDRRYKKETYENAVDDFTQPQVHMINDWQLSPNLNLTNTFYFIHGQGYYENLKNTAKLTDFGMDYFNTIDPNLFGSDSLYYYQTEDDTALFKTDDGDYIVERTDLSRKKWVDKDQYGWIGKLTVTGDDEILTLGTSIYLFNSNHHGSVIWAKNMPNIYDPERKYYKYNGDKKSISLYLNYLYDMFPNTKVLVNMLYEHKTYAFKQNETALFTGAYLNQYNVTYNFYSPRMGINFKASDNLSFFGNISFAQREPTDNQLFDLWTGPDDLGAAPLFAKSDTIRQGGEIQYVKWEEPYVKPESVIDYEAGLAYIRDNFTVKANYYYMDFSDEIVPLGTIDKDGNPIRGNAEKTIHSGIEFSLAYAPSNNISMTGNLAWSKNFYRLFFQESWEGGVVDLSGNTIAGFPDLIGNFRLSGSWQKFSSALFLKYVGKQYLDNTQNENRIIDPFTRVDLMLRYRIEDFYYFPEIRFMFKIINLLDEEYETAGYYDSWGGLAYYYPAAVRNYYLAISFSL